MDFPPRASFNAGSLRPPSRAWSESTERPGSSTGPKTISQEIDHIKNLVARAHDAPPQHSGSVTAVLFRNSKHSGEPVTHSQIFHELDSLKKRIKHEQHEPRPALERRISQIDPGQESESEAESVFDERDEELQRAQERVEKQREQLESLLESAELRVDALTSEKERLEAQLRESTCERQSVQAALQAAQEDIVRLNRQVQHLTTSLQQNQKQLEALRAEKSHAEEAHKTAQQCIEQLQARKDEAEASSLAANERLAKLEGENKQVTEHLQKLLETHAESDRTRKEELDTLRKRCDSATSERDQQQSVVAELQRKLETAHALVVQERNEHEKRRDQLVGQVEEQKGRLTDAVHVAERHKKEHAEATYERDRKQDTINELGEKLELATAQVHNLKNAHKDDVDQLKSEHAAILAATSKTHKSELEQSKVAYERQLIALRGELDQAQQKASSVHISHTKELEALHSQYRAQLDSASSDLDDLKRQLREVEASAHAKYHRTNGLLASELQVTASLLQQIDSLDAENAQKLKDAQTALGGVVEQLRSSRDAFAELESSTRESGLHAKSEEISKIIKELDSTKQEKDAEAADYEQRMNKLTEELDVARAKQQDTETSHAAALELLQKQHARALEQAEEKHKAANQDLRSQAHTENEHLRREIGHALSRVSAIESGNEAHIMDLEARHMAEIKALSEKLETQVVEHERTLEAHDSKLHSLQVDHDARLASLQAEHAQEVGQLQSTLESQLQQAKSSYEQTLAEHETAWTAKMLQINTEHSTALAAAQQQHRAALDAAVAKARQSGQAEVRNLKKRHQDAVAQIRLSISKYSPAQLTALEHTHRKEIDAAREQAPRATEENSTSQAAAHSWELRGSETASAAKLADVKARLQEEKAAAVAAKEQSFKAELAAMQARLDGSLTGQAEAERSLASLRQQLAQTDRRVAEAKIHSEDLVVALSKEKVDLTQQLEEVKTSLRDLQIRHSSRAATPRFSVTGPRREEVTEEVTEDVNELKLQLSTMAEERATMRILLQKRLDEKSEVAKQNEFLVNELEMLSQQGSRPKLSSRSTIDALIQTDTLVSGPDADSASLTPNKTRVSRPSPRYSHPPTTLLSASVRQAKNGFDRAWRSRSFEDYLDNSRAHPSELGSVISANEALFARQIQEHIGELQRAKDDLSADYNAKIGSLAQGKALMERMVTSKQTAALAKDRKKLLAKYGEDFESPFEPNAMLTSMPVDQVKALRHAEEELVAAHSKRLSKRKSQIALKHAEEFRSITQEYDRKIADLTNNRSLLEGDLSVDPSRFEDEYGRFRTTSMQLAAERLGVSPHCARKNSVSLLRVPNDEPVPKLQPSGDPAEAIEAPSSPLTTRHQRTSTPRTSRSIPREASSPWSAFHVGNRDSPDATSQPWQRRERRESGKHPPTPQQSFAGPSSPAPRLLLDNASPEPSVPPLPARGRTNIRSSTNPSVSSKAATSLGIDPTAFAKQRHVGAGAQPPPEQPGQPHKTGFLRRMKERISHDGAHPSSFPGSGSLFRSAPAPQSTPPKPSTFRPLHSTSRSRHFSSGMIYYREPAEIPAPASAIR